MSHASGRNVFSASKTYQHCLKRADGDSAALLAQLTAPGIREAVLEEMAAFEPVGQGMMGEQYRNDAGAVVPGWMVQVCGTGFWWSSSSASSPNRVRP